MSGSSSGSSCPPTAAPRFPSALPQYEFVQYLGGGGMGEIYKARHVHLDRSVVIKWLRNDLALSRDMEARFAREMQVVGLLSHPNIVNATDAGIADGRRYLVMEYIDGIDLAELGRRVGRLSIADACEVIRQSAIALAHAHQRGIVHRDIKPTNLMLAGDGVVKLLDLGLALLQGEDPGADAPLTRADSGPFGTYDYMSPEQWDNSHSVDHRGDIYSLGCTLYYLLTGHAPYDTPQHKGPTSKMRGHVIEAIPSIRQQRPDVPKKLAGIIETMLAKRADDRFQSGAEVADALASFCDGSDLRSLIAAAHSADSGPVNPDSKTDPRSATIVVGSSVGERSKPVITNLDTAPIRSSTAFAGRVATPPRRGTPPWLMIGLGTLLVAAGVGAGVYFATRGTGQSAGRGEQADVALNAAGSTPSDDSSPAGNDRTAVLTSQSPSGEESAASADPADAVVTVVDPAGPAEEMPVTPEPDPMPAPVPNLVPVFAAIPEQLINELEPFSLLVELTNIAELRGKVAFALAPGAPRGMRIDAATGVIRWEPGEADGGPDSSFLVTVQVKPLDAGIDPAESAFSIRVAEVNQPPRVSLVNQRALVEAAARVEAVEGEPVEVLIEVADDDLPANPLRVTAVRALPPGAELEPVEDNPRAWRLMWTPGEEHGGADPVILALAARDGQDSGDVVSIAFDVAEVNEPPVLASLNGDRGRPDAPWNVEINERETLELLLAAGDVDLPANPLELNAVGKLPGDAKIVPVEGDARSWKLAWTPGEEHGGEKPVTLRLMVRDGADNSVERSVVVNVAEVNEPPVLATISGRAVGDEREWPLDAREGKPLEVAIVSRDDDLPANPLRIEAIGDLPTGAKFEPDPENPRAWKLLWTPGEEHGGDEPLRIPVRVRDDSDHSETTMLVVKVAEVNVAPTFAAVNGIAAVADKPWEVNGKEGAELQITISGEDLDRPLNTLTLAGGEGLPEGARIEPVKGKPRAWTISWAPGEQHGGDEPVSIPLKLSDDAGESVETTLLARIAEVNTAPVLPEIAAQTVGLGETFSLEISLSDPDLPRQALEFELEQPAGANATAELINLKDGEMAIRLAWTPSIETDLGETRQFTLRIKDNGEPPLSAERSFEVSVGRYVTNSIGMQLALLPPGTFKMGNLNPELLEKMIPKAPEQPKQPERPAVPGVPGTNPLRPNVPGQPNNPNVPVPQGVRPAAAEAATAEDGEKEEEEAELPQDDLPIREVTLTQPLYIGAFEVTQQQYAAVMESNPSYFQPEGSGARSVNGLDAATLPVESVTYEDAVEFCRRLSALPEEKRKGRTYRLPSETEWEYACRGGRETLFHTGDRLSSREANFDGRFPVLDAAPGPSLQRPAPVGSYEPNAFGLHDMHGNVSEWCRDWYAADAYASSDPLAGPEQGEARVIRGGSYRSKWAYQCRSSIRDSAPPTDRSPRLGFRVVCEVRAAPVEGPLLP